MAKLIKEIGTRYYKQTTQADAPVEITKAEYKALEISHKAIYQAWSEPIYNTPDGKVDMTALIDYGIFTFNPATGERL